MTNYESSVFVDARNASERGLTPVMPMGDVA
jgi:hypothetical protein